MNFEGEHLLPGQIGHFFLLLSLVASLTSAIAFYLSGRANGQAWNKLARLSFFTQIAAVFIVFSVVFYICSNHYYEYMYAYKHASKELEYKYLLACIWEGQEGSFLLWSLWHSVLGFIFLFSYRKKTAEFVSTVMSILCFAQFLLFLMMMGVYFFDVRIGNSLFTLTRNEINAPIFAQANYLNFIRDGLGLNVLLRNYWMVIHPPVLFLGFAACLIPFAFAVAALKERKYGNWVVPALPWTLFATCVLGVGIMMGGKWAYESLSFGGYWAWDPVENASLVPWLMLVAGLHTMVIYKSTGHSLKASILFIICAFLFVLYSTFLTRTGILGETSVHAFTEAGNVMNILILSFLLLFAVPAFVLFLIRQKDIPVIVKEESTSSREFWMFIGSIVFFLTALFVIAKTSAPVINKIFGTQIAPPEDVEFSYNKVVIMVAIIIGILTAISQFLKYKSTPSKYVVTKLSIPAVIAAVFITTIAVAYPITYYKHGFGYLGAIYLALFAAIFAVVANGWYVLSVLKGKLSNAGASVTHIGFSLMIAGMLITSGNKKVISSSRVNGITLPAGKDPMTRQTDDPQENLTLIRQVPAKMDDYEVTYDRDSMGHEKGRKFYKLDFVKKNTSHNTIEKFQLEPDVYLMKDNNMSSNPDTKHYFSRDVFTYVSFALNNKNEDTASFREVIMNIKDTGFYRNGFFVLNEVIKNPNNGRYHFSENDQVLAADIRLTAKNNLHFTAQPAIQLLENDVIQHDDTLYAQNMYFRFLGVTDNQKVRIGIKESDALIDFVTVKAYVFPFIILVWSGLVIMAIGLLMSMVKRARISPALSRLLILALSAGVFYLFLLN